MLFRQNSRPSCRTGAFSVIRLIRQPRGTHSVASFLNGAASFWLLLCDDYGVVLTTPRAPSKPCCDYTAGLVARGGVAVCSPHSPEVRPWQVPAPQTRVPEHAAGHSHLMAHCQRRVRPAGARESDWCAQGGAGTGYTAWHRRAYRHRGVSDLSDSCTESARPTKPHDWLWDRVCRRAHCTRGALGLTCM